MVKSNVDILPVVFDLVIIIRHKKKTTPVKLFLSEILLNFFGLRCGLML
jgi:hypothetical protein